MHHFYKNYIKIYTNKKGRHFPRTSKVPFTKWYVKGYSIFSQKLKIICAILDGTINSLNKNLKVKAGKFLSIDLI
jgi:hypothetical protein